MAEFNAGQPVSLGDLAKNSIDQEMLDRREALFNDGATGRVEEIQVSKEDITLLRGILYDLDINLYRPSALVPSIADDPREFYEEIAAVWLSRHSVLSKAEVRMSGTGLHAILWFDEPIELKSEGERDRWEGVLKVVQAALPVDPRQPALTATTRELGSINSKNKAAVTQLKAGNPVTQEEVLSLYRDMCDKSFSTVFQILAGSTSINPCPFCKAERSHFSAEKSQGVCYGACGAIKLTQLYDLIFSSRTKKEAHHE